eukprot:evm.model.NODE_40553_length_18732_cov_22.576180.6
MKFLAATLVAIAAPAMAFMPAARVPTTPVTALSAAIKAGGDYYPGQVDYGNSQIDVFETVKTNGKFNQLAKALAETGLDKALVKENGIFCMYAPTDEAFDKAGGVDELLKDKAALTEVLKYHVVKLFVKDKEHIRSFRLSNKATLQGGKVRVQVKANPDGESFVIFNNGEAECVDGLSDIDAVNGHVHGISGILTPQAGGTIPVK